MQINIGGGHCPFAARRTPKCDYRCSKDIMQMQVMKICTEEECITDNIGFVNLSASTLVDCI